MDDTHECKMCGDLGTWSMRDGDYTCPECWALLNALDVEYDAALAQSTTRTKVDERTDY